MKTRILFALLLLTLVVGTFSAHIKDVPQKKYCTDERDPTFKLAVGEQGPSSKGSCMLVRCQDVVDGKSVLTAIGCGVFMASPGCKTVDYDNTKLYPDCCPNEIC